MLFQSTFDLDIILCHCQENDIHDFSHPSVATAHKAIATNTNLTVGGKTILGYINSTEYRQSEVFCLNAELIHQLWFVHFE